MDFSNIKCTDITDIKHKNKSNNQIITGESVRRLFYESDKPMTMDYMNEAVKHILKQHYESFKTKEYKNKIIDFQFCAVNISYGTTDWIPIDPNNIKEIDDIDINKTYQLYEHEEKKFDDSIERNYFWLTFRFRDKIGYGLNKGVELVSETIMVFASLKH